MHTSERLLELKIKRREQHLNPSLSVKTLMFVVVFTTAALLVAADSLIIPNQLIALAQQQYGESASQKIQRWQQLFVQLKDADEDTKLKQVNQFFNDELPFVSDEKHWQKEDYWATPFEALVTNGADCEDYVIAKYHALRELGVDMHKLRITYVKAIRLNEAHMVLSYFPTKDAIPLVLDNLIDPIASADKRTDLVPVYSFNAEGMWLERMKGEGVRMGNPNKLDLWTDLRVRMHELGLDL